MTIDNNVIIRTVDFNSRSSVSKEEVDMVLAID